MIPRNRGERQSKDQSKDESRQSQSKDASLVTATSI